MTKSDTSRDTSFGLEITPGPWEIEYYDSLVDECTQIGPISSRSTDHSEIDNSESVLCVKSPGDIHAISAVPELLEVALNRHIVEINKRYE